MNIFFFSFLGVFILIHLRIDNLPYVNRYKLQTEKKALQQTKLHTKKKKKSKLAAIITQTC